MKSASVVVVVALAAMVVGCGSGGHSAGVTKVFRAADPLTPLGKSLYFKVHSDSADVVDGVEQFGFHGAPMVTAPAARGERRCSFTREITNTIEPSGLRTWAGHKVTVTIYSTMPKTRFSPSCQSLEPF